MFRMVRCWIWDKGTSTLCDLWASQCRHNERDGVSNHQPHDCFFKRLFRRRSKKTSKLRVTGLCERNSRVTGESPPPQHPPPPTPPTPPTPPRHTHKRKSNKKGFIIDIINRDHFKCYKGSSEWFLLILQNKHMDQSSSFLYMLDMLDACGRDCPNTTAGRDSGFWHCLLFVTDGFPLQTASSGEFGGVRCWPEQGIEQKVIWNV